MKWHCYNCDGGGQGGYPHGCERPIECDCTCGRNGDETLTAARAEWDADERLRTVARLLARHEQDDRDGPTATWLPVIRPKHLVRARQVIAAVAADDAKCSAETR